jgi:hypothetical protein
VKTKQYNTGQASNETHADGELRNSHKERRCGETAQIMHSALRRERARQPHSHSSHKKTISEADLLSHERAVCPSSRAISGRWRWLHAAQPASDRALTTLDERLAAMRTSARQCVVIRNFV